MDGERRLEELRRMARESQEASAYYMDQAFRAAGQPSPPARPEEPTRLNEWRKE